MNKDLMARPVLVQHRVYPADNRKQFPLVCVPVADKPIPHLFEQITKRGIIGFECFFSLNRVSHKFIIIVLAVLSSLFFTCTTTWGASKTFNVTTGMIDAVGSSALPDSAMYGGISTTITLTPPSWTGWFGDYSIDDTLATLGSVTVDSAYFIWMAASFAGGTGDTLWQFLVAVSDNRDWVEVQATWNSFKTGSAWTTAGGDAAGTISDSVKITSVSHPDHTWDTLTVRRTGTAYGANFLDSLKVSSGNFGFQIKQVVLGGHNYHLFDLYSTEEATASPNHKPSIVVFYTVVEAGTTGARRRIMEIGGG